MKEYVSGHVYYVDELSSEEKGCIARNNQKISFVCRFGDKYPGNLLKNKSNGTNCQELIRVLIARLFYLQNQKFCIENVICVWLLRVVLWLFEFRAMRKKGKFKVIMLNHIEQKETKHDGHIM